MKWAGAVMPNSTGRAVRRSNVPVNHAGTTGSTHDKVSLRGVSASTCASAILVPQGAVGWGSSVVAEGVQAAPGFGLSNAGSR